MGLDITHIQLTLTPHDKYDFFTVDDWDINCNVPLQHYSKYVQTIDDLDFNKSIAIVNNEYELEKLKETATFNETAYLKVFIGELDEVMQAQYRSFITREKLDTLETLQSSTEQNGLTYHTISFGEPVKVQGVYYIDDIGSQRQGMNDVFYNTFKQYIFWGKKEDFELAYTCIGSQWYLETWGQQEVDKMKNNFKTHFIDKFEFGKSLLDVSF